jgi:hypothetical protein
VSIARRRRANNASDAIATVAANDSKTKIAGVLNFTPTDYHTPQSANHVKCSGRVGAGASGHCHPDTKDDML